MSCAPVTAALSKGDGLKGKRQELYQRAIMHGVFGQHTDYTHNLVLAGHDIKEFLKDGAWSIIRDQKTGVWTLSSVNDPIGCVAWMGHNITCRSRSRLGCTSLRKR